MSIERMNHRDTEDAEGAFGARDGINPRVNDAEEKGGRGTVAVRGRASVDRVTEGY